MGAFQQLHGDVLTGPWSRLTNIVFFELKDSLLLIKV